MTITINMEEHRKDEFSTGRRSTLKEQPTTANSRHVVSHHISSQSHCYDTQSNTATFKDETTVIQEIEQSCTTLVATMKAFSEFFDVATLASPEQAVCKLLKSNITKAIALFFTLRDVTSVTGLLGALHPYVLSFCDNESIFADITTMISALFNSDTKILPGYTPQDGFNSDKWVTELKQCYTNWKLARNSPIFKHMSTILGLLVTLGVCKTSGTDFTIAGFKIMQEQSYKKHMCVTDIIEAVMSTVTLFVEGAHKCFTTGSFAPLIYGVDTDCEIEDIHTRLLAEWDAIRIGNLQLVHNRPDNEFSMDLETVLEAYTNQVKLLKPRDLYKDLLNRRIVNLHKYKAHLLLLSSNGDIKEAPFAFVLTGGTCLGKSTLNNCIIDHLLHSQGYDLDPSLRGNIDAADKFQSKWRSGQTVAIIDDAANLKAEFVDIPISTLFLKWINNVPSFAIRPDVNDKGKIPFDPKVIAVTTNIWHMDTMIMSNHPGSILRRFLHILVTVIPQWLDKYGRLDTKKLALRDTTNDKDGIADIYLLTISEAGRPARDTDVPKLEPITYNGRRMVNVTSSECIVCLKDLFNTHTITQRAVVANSKVVKHTLVKCSHEGCIHSLETCPIHNKEHLIANSTAPLVLRRESIRISPPEISTLSVSPHDHIIPDDPGFYSSISEQAGFIDRVLAPKPRYTPVDVPGLNIFDALSVNVLRNIFPYANSYFACLRFLPDNIVYHPKFRLFLYWWFRDTILRTAANSEKMASIKKKFFFFNMLLCTLFPFFGYLISFILWLVLMFIILVSADTLQRDYIDAIARKRALVPALLADEKTKCVAAICGASVAMTILYKIVKLYTTVKSTGMLTQSTISPASVAEAMSRKNVWEGETKPPSSVPEALHKARTTTCENMIAKVSKNQLYGFIEYPNNQRKVVNVLVLRTGAFLICDHYFRSGEPYLDKKGDPIPGTVDPDKYVSSMEWTCVQPIHKGKQGKSFRINLEMDSSIKIPGKDLRICWVPKRGDFEDITGFFSTSAFKGVAGFTMIRTTHDGTIQQHKGRAIGANICHTHDKFGSPIMMQGANYQYLSCNTYEGLCGSLSISETVPPTVLCVHIGGETGTPKGIGATLSLGEIENALSALSEKPSIVFSASAAPLHTYIFREKLKNGRPTHHKSPLNFISPDHTFNIHGGCIGKTKMISSLRKSPISDLVDSVMGIPNVHGEPDFGRANYNTLNNMAQPGTPMPFHLIQAACEDYLKPIYKLLVNIPEWCETKPLTHDQTLGGINAWCFVNRINLSTAAGMGLPGKKKDHIIYGDGIDPDFADNFTLSDEIMAEIEVYISKLKNSRRTNCVAKSNKKDEASKIKYDETGRQINKCRNFFAAGTPISYIMRKYFTPIINILQNNPLISETSVGINCFSPEWEELFTHLERFQDDKGSQWMATDYAKFDQKLSSQLLIAAFDIMISIAVKCNYSEDDLDIMRAVVSDIVYSYIAFDGDLIELTEGTHVSGNAATVILNGLCGAINMRAAFYSMYATEIPFRNAVSMTTYGDDCAGTVNNHFPNFNMVSFAKYLAKYGQKITMADKEAELVPFVSCDEVDFLKRTSILSPDLGVRVGALAESSITKSLHNVVHTNKDLTIESISAQCIDGALREWFGHGKEIYERRRLQLIEIATGANIEHLCLDLEIPYHTRCAMWHEKYDTVVT